MKSKIHFVHFVYRLVNGKYQRLIGDSYQPIEILFPFLECMNIGSSRILRCEFYLNEIYCKAWIDKHDNVIVRYMDNRQTKIKF